MAIRLDSRYHTWRLDARELSIVLVLPLICRSVCSVHSPCLLHSSISRLVNGWRYGTLLFLVPSYIIYMLQGKKGTCSKSFRRYHPLPMLRRASIPAFVVTWLQHLRVRRLPALLPRGSHHGQLFLGARKLPVADYRIPGHNKKRGISRSCS